MIHVLGLDSSVNSPGLCVYGQASRYKPNTTKTGERLELLDIWLSRKLERYEIDVCVMEGYGFTPRMSKDVIGTICEVAGVFKLALHRAGVPIVTVSPSSLKVAGASNGSATKEQMIKAALKRGARLFEGNDDEADAFHLWDLGDRYYNDRKLLEDRQLEVADKLKWPSLTTRTTT